MPWIRFSSERKGVVEKKGGVCIQARSGLVGWVDEWAVGRMDGRNGMNGMDQLALVLVLSTPMSRLMMIYPT